MNETIKGVIVQDPSSGEQKTVKIDYNSLDALPAFGKEEVTSSEDVQNWSKSIENNIANLIEQTPFVCYLWGNGDSYYMTSDFSSAGSPLTYAAVKEAFQNKQTVYCLQPTSFTEQVGNVYTLNTCTGSGAVFTQIFYAGKKTTLQTVRLASDNSVYFYGIKIDEEALTTGLTRLDSIESRVQILEQQLGSVSSQLEVIVNGGS